MSTFKRYLLSSTVTFISAFAFIVVPQLGSVDYTKSALAALLAVGIRAGFKAVGEWMTGATGDPQSTAVSTLLGE